MNSDDKILLRAADFMWVLGVLMIMGAHFVTNMAFMSIADVSGATIQQVTRVYEANPVEFNLIMSLGGLLRMLFYLIVPAFMLAVYYVCRRQYIKTKPVILAFFAAMIFFLGMLNFLNDLSLLLGLMIQQGLI